MIFSSYRSLVCILLVVLCQQAFGFQQPKPEKSQFLLYIDSAIQGGAKAAFYYEKAHALISNDFERLNYHNELAYDMYAIHQKPDSAMALLKANIAYGYDESKGSDYLKQLSRSYWYLGRFARELRDFDLILEQIPDAIRLFENFAPAQRDVNRFYSYMGYAYDDKQDYKNALMWYEKLIKHSAKHKLKSYEAHGHFLIGQIYMVQDKTKLAKQSYQYALFITEKYFPKDWQEIFRNHNSLGALFIYENQLDSALYHYKQTEAYLAKNPHKIPDETLFYFQAINNKNIGNINYLENRLDEAERYTLKAQNHFDEYFSKTSTRLINNLKQLARIYQKQGRDRLAVSTMTRTLEISRMHDFKMVLAYVRMGEIFQKLGDDEKAGIYYDSALVAADIQLTEVIDPQFRFDAKDVLGAVLGKIDIEQRKPTNDMAEIEDIFQKFSHVAGLTYEQAEARSVVQEVPNGLEDLYHIYKRSYEETGNAQWLNRLWSIVEINKSKKLFSQLKREYSMRSSLPAETVTRHRQLKDSLMQAQAKAPPGGFDSTLYKVQKAYNIFMNNLNESHPKYYNLVSGLATPSLSFAQKHLEKDQLLLNFLDGPNRLILLKVTQNSMDYLDLSKEMMAQLVDEVNQGIVKNDLQLLNEASAKIRGAFGIEESDLEGIRQLTIIPDGLVWDLNFNALSNGDQNNTQYMGNRYQIVYHYGANNLQKTASRSTPSSVLAVAFNDDNSISTVNRKTLFRDNTDDLPGTSDEVKAIAGLWPGQYLFAEEANETVFKSESQRHGILHIAVHGILDKADPSNSYLQFVGKDSLNDGKLHTYEIQSMSLNADLAILSACYSGKGEVYGGEGMQSLGRAFSFAGVRSLLVSRWEVSDFTAPHLMRYFHEGLKKGMYKSEALRYAQTEYLKNHADNLTSSPFYWSSFYILGDDSPIYKSAKISPWMLIWLVVVLASTQFFTRRKKQKAA